jgi:hypothetical protein
MMRMLMSIPLDRLIGLSSGQVDETQLATLLTEVNQAVKSAG